MESEDKLWMLIIIASFMTFFLLVGGVMTTSYMQTSNMARQHQVYLRGWYPNTILKNVKEIK